MRKSTQNLTSMMIGFLLIASPVLALSPVEDFILNLKAAGIQLILLWLLTLSIVYGVLSHLSVPKSASVRGVIAIVSAFMVLLAAAGTQAASFVSTLTTSSLLIAFGLIITMSFIELVGAKAGGEHIFAKHPKVFGGALILLAVLVFIGAGGLGIINFPSIALSDPLIAILFFLVIMLAAVWILVGEGKN